MNIEDKREYERSNKPNIRGILGIPQPTGRRIQSSVGRQRAEDAADAEEAAKRKVIDQARANVERQEAAKQIRMDMEEEKAKTNRQTEFQESQIESLPSMGEVNLPTMVSGSTGLPPLPQSVVSSQQPQQQQPQQQPQGPQEPLTPPSSPLTPPNNTENNFPV